MSCNLSYKFYMNFCIKISKNGLAAQAFPTPDIGKYVEPIQENTPKTRSQR